MVIDFFENKTFFSDFCKLEDIKYINEIILIIMIDKFIIEKFIIFYQFNYQLNPLIIFDKVKKFLVKLSKKKILNNSSTFRCKDCNLNNNCNHIISMNTNHYLKCEYCCNFNQYLINEIQIEDYHKSRLNLIIDTKKIISYQFYKTGGFDYLNIYL